MCHAVHRVFDVPIAGMKIVDQSGYDIIRIGLPLEQQLKFSMKEAQPLTGPELMVKAFINQLTNSCLESGFPSLLKSAVPFKK